MSRGPLRFKQADVTRAVRAVAAAGVDVREVVVDTDGAIRVIVGAPPTAPDRHANEWDSVFNEPPAS
jgi:hypothetical protein